MASHLLKHTWFTRICEFARQRMEEDPQGIGKDMTGLDIWIVRRERESEKKKHHHKPGDIWGNKEQLCN